MDVMLIVRHLCNGHIPANCNAVNTAKQTPLHIAARFGHTRIAYELLCGNADVTLRDQNNDTAMDIAKVRGHNETEWLIKNWPNIKKDKVCQTHM